MEEIPEINLSSDERAKLSPAKTWMHEATRKSDLARLYTTVSYRHTVRGDWEAALVYADGTVEHLSRIPRIILSSKLWAITSYGVGVRQEGRNS